MCQAVREEGLGSGGWWGAPQRSLGGFSHWAGLQDPAPQSPGTRPDWQRRSHVSAVLLFLAGSWDIMTASILETLFKAGEIARFGGEKTQQPVLISSRRMVTTVTGIYRHQEAGNSSRHFCTPSGTSSDPTPDVPANKAQCTQLSLQFISVFISVPHVHSRAAAIYKLSLVTAGAGLSVSLIPPPWGERIVHTHGWV